MNRIPFALLLSLVPLFAADEPPRLPTAEAEKLCRTDAAPVPPLEAPRTTSFAPLLDKATPSIVSVFPAMVVSDPNATGPLQRFFGGDGGEAGEGEKEGEAAETQEPQELIKGVGSGVIVSADGWIVTNSHVVHLASGKVADTFFVELHDHRRFHAKIAGADPATDLALLKIEATELSPISFADSDQVKAGDLVFAVGNPFQIGITCTMGMVSATRRSQLAIGGESAYQSFIQTDAAINPGNSGGALIDAGGRLIGINTAIYSGIGGNVGIGFAIPANLVRRIAADLAAEGKVTRGFFGISSKTVDDAAAKRVKLPSVAGAAVEAVMEASPAATAGLQAGDIVVAAAGKPVTSRGDLRFEMSLVKPGSSISLDYWRDGAVKTVSLTAGTEPAKEQNLEDARVDALPGVLFRQAGSVVTVTAVNSKAAKQGGLEAGMAIIAINGKEITDIASISAALRSGVNKVQTRQDKIERTLAIRIE